MRGRPSKYPWRRMAVGDNFIIPSVRRTSIKGCVSHLQPMKFRFKEMMISGVISTRVWRVQ